MRYVYNNKLIAKNSALLYIRMIVVMVINLYIVRIVLNALGVLDYGLYNVVAGVVTLFSSVTIVLSSATQRFFSFYIGQDNSERLNQVYSICINIFVITSFIILIIGESLGLWFVTSSLNIPEERINAVKNLFHLSLISFAVSVVQIPFSALIISNEKMSVYSIITILDYTLRLLSAFVLAKVNFDKLIFYGCTILVVQIIVTFLYIIYSLLKFPECRYTFYFDKSLYKELLSFSGWTLFGSLASVCMIQVNTILVNIFFGPLVNASRAIALQVNSALSSFSNSYIMAIKPPMIKAYADGNELYLLRLFNLSNVFIYFSLFIIALPLFIHMPFILGIWIGEVSADAILFSRLVLLYCIIMALNNPITIIIQAINRVKEYHIKVEFFTLLCMPLTYIAFKLGLGSSWTFILMIVLAILAHGMRLICLRKYFSLFSIKHYLFSFFFKSIVLSVFCVFVCVITKSTESTWISFIYTCIISMLISIMGVFFIILSRDERKIVVSFIQRLSHTFCI